jgi:hypothetical protein
MDFSKPVIVDGNKFHFLMEPINDILPNPVIVNKQISILLEDHDYNYIISKCFKMNPYISFNKQLVAVVKKNQFPLVKPNTYYYLSIQILGFKEFLNGYMEPLIQIMSFLPVRVQETFV